MRRLLRGGARLFYRIRGYVPTRMDGSSFRGDPYHIGFWRDVAAGRWEPGTIAFLREHLDTTSTFLDVGAWIGPLSMAAARRCATVYSFEPDPVAYRFLLWNLDLNRLTNVVPFHSALAARTGFRTLSGRDGALGTSRSSILSSSDGPNPRVLAWGWAEWLEVARPGRLDCIKMDVEGGEFELLPEMADYLRSERPSLHLSFHPSFLPEPDRAKRILEAMVALRHYRTIRDVDGREIGLEDVRDQTLARNGSFIFTG